MFKKIPYRITGITGIELGEHAHHQSPIQSCRSLQALYLCKRLDFTRFL